MNTLTWNIIGFVLAAAGGWTFRSALAHRHHRRRFRARAARPIAQLVIDRLVDEALRDDRWPDCARTEHLGHDGGVVECALPAAHFGDHAYLASAVRPPF